MNWLDLIVFGRLSSFGCVLHAPAIVSRFWDGGRGLVSDDLGHRSFSEHAQALALSLDVLPEALARCAATNLVESADLIRTTVYFSHYLFDAYAKIGRPDLILKRMDLWRGYVARDLKTAQEEPDAPDGSSDSRSDCHAWSAHPLYHLTANVLGLRPSAPFFRRVRIAPQPGGLKRIRSTTPTPRGDVVCDLRFGGSLATGTVTLPSGLEGEFVWNGETRRFGPGVTDVGEAETQPIY